MKFLLPLIILLFQSQAYAQSTSSLFAETPGVFTSPETNGDWFFAEVRELNGSLSGCFASTKPMQGDYPFETADLNLLAYKEGEDVVAKIGVNDVAGPGIPTSRLVGFPVNLYSDASSPAGVLDNLVTIFLFKNPSESGRFTAVTEVTDRAIGALKKGRQAGLSITSERSAIYYSLSGSSAILSRWQECKAKL